MSLETAAGLLLGNRRTTEARKARKLPLKVCLEAGCGNPVSYRGRCSDHARLREGQIDRGGSNIYSTRRWKVLRRRKLFLNPICEAESCDQVATDVHHKVDLADGGDPWRLQGLESLCKSHHSRLTRAGQMTFG